MRKTHTEIHLRNEPEHGHKEYKYLYPKKMGRSKEANRGYFHRHIEAMLSYMGWFTCTDTYDCYQSRIKPYIHVGRLKKIISKIKRRQNHEGMDQGKMLRGAAGAAACG